MAVSFFLFIIIFCVVVVSHEFGHFIVAKKNGIHVTEFFVGMGPNLFSFQKGGTKYSLKLLPIGGACVFEGEDGLQGEKGEAPEGAFSSAPVWARIATIFAGPLFNFIMAYLMALLLVWECGIYVPDISGVTQGGAAQEAGILEGDTITKIDGHRVHMWDDIRLAALTNRGESMEIEFERQGERHTVNLTPVYDTEADTYRIGVQGGNEVLVCNVPQTFRYGFYAMEYSVKATVKSLSMLVKGQLSKDDVSGPVGMVKYVDDTYDAVKDYGTINVVLNMINIAMMLCISLGIMNLLPIPALDGGRLVFLLIEAVRGKPIPPEKEGMVHLGGMMALLVLMAIVFVNDITKFFR